MLLDAFILLSPTIALGAYLIVRRTRAAGRGRAVAARIKEDTDARTKAPSFRAEPKLARPEAPAPQAEPVSEPETPQTPEAPVFKSSRAEPPLRATEAPREVFHIDFDEEK